MDTRAYEKGELDTKTKELLGLAASMVLAHAISYDIICHVQEDVTDEEFFEALNVALVVKGAITIPHIRCAVEILDQCRDMQKTNKYLRLWKLRARR